MIVLAIYKFDTRMQSNDMVICWECYESSIYQNANDTELTMEVNFL